MKDRIVISSQNPKWNFENYPKFTGRFTGEVITNPKEEGKIMYYVFADEQDILWNITASYAITNAIDKIIESDDLHDGLFDITWKGKTDLKDGGKTLNMFEIGFTPD